MFPPYIYGMHDRGGEHLMQEAGKPGWVLVTEAVGADPHDVASASYEDLAGKGLGVIVRLNHGYGTVGTLPHSGKYEEFARRCGNFVEGSAGCHIWIVGNEMNLAWERPGGPGQGEVITPLKYALAFLQCREEIQSRQGHENDLVVVSAVGPWNVETQYPGNPFGDWVKYFTDVLEILDFNVDGISLHTYTHGGEPVLVGDEGRMNPPFNEYHYHFRAYRDFMAAIPRGLRDRPVFITEADQYGPWHDGNSGWVQNAYREIDAWNRGEGNQPIQALILYRWQVGNPNDPRDVGWAICNKPGVQEDFREAMRLGCRVYGI